MRKTLASAVAMLALSAATALAADASYPHASKPPLIAGTVVSLNDYQIVVDTGQGQPLTLEIDSRTLTPTGLAPGTVVEIEFKLMENGRHYASRIVPARGGMGPDRKTAYGSAHGSHAATARDRSASGSRGGESVAARTTPETLPQTGSRQPLIALLGMVALGAAGLIMLARRLRRV